MWTIAYSLLVFVTFAAADEAFYQSVNGKCSDVHPVRNYNALKAASGRWYHQYVSYGKEGDSCASTHGVQRGTTVYLDFFIYDKKAIFILSKSGVSGIEHYNYLAKYTILFGEKPNIESNIRSYYKTILQPFYFGKSLAEVRNHYVRFADDVTYHPHQPSVYTNAKGDHGSVIASDILSYGYWVQCVEGNPTKISVIFTTREPEINKKEEEVYKDMSAKLEKMNLLPKMHKINQTNCPPKYLVEIEKPV